MAKFAYYLPTYIDFQIYVLQDLSALSVHVSADQRPFDVGGTLPYNHTCFLNFYEVSIFSTRFPQGQRRCFVFIDSYVYFVFQQFEAIERKVNRLLNTTTTTHAQAPSTCTELDDVSHWCSDLLSRTDVTAPSHFAVHQVKRSPIFLASRENLEKLAREVERRRATNFTTATMTSQKSNKYVEKASKVRINFLSNLTATPRFVVISQVRAWLETVGLPALHKQPEIPDCSSKAEIFLNSFETGFCAVANVR